MATGVSNPNPIVHRPSPGSSKEQYDPLVSEIFDLIRDIKDPEHPHTLEELNVIKESDITLCHRPPSANSSTGQSPPNSQSDQHTLPNPQRQATDQATGASSLTTSSFSDDEEVWIRVQFTPTVPHCSLATLIGLCLRVKLERSLQRSFKLDIFVNEGSHSIEEDVNKQINDKERVAAAMENPNLREMVEECIKEIEY